MKHSTILTISLFLFINLYSSAQDVAPADGSGTEKSYDKKVAELNTEIEEFNKWLSGDTTGTFLKKTSGNTPPAEDKTTGTSGFLQDFENFDWGVATTTSKSIIIGSQTWSAANLDVTTFRNGDVIPEAKTAGDWLTAYNAKKPAWCYYDNDPANAAKYGKLYNVHAVTDARGLAPAGWHIPSKAELDKLMSALPDNADTGKKLKGTGNGDYAFVQGGYFTNDEFKSIGILGFWWTSTKKTIYGAWGSSVSDGAIGYSLNTNQNRFYSGDYGSDGLSVRCVKD